MIRQVLQLKELGRNRRRCALCKSRIDTGANFSAWGARILSPSTSIIDAFRVQVTGKMGWKPILAGRWMGMMRWLPIKPFWMDAFGKMHVASTPVKLAGLWWWWHLWYRLYSSGQVKRRFMGDGYQPHQLNHMESYWCVFIYIIFVFVFPKDFWPCHSWPLYMIYIYSFFFLCALFVGTVIVICRVLDPL